MVFGIDESSKTVGGYVDDRGRLHGFLKDNEAFTVIDFPGARATFASRINAQGQIVGAYSPDDPNLPALELPIGFLLDKGVFTKIDFPGAVRTQPFGINNLGQIVGQYVDAEGKSHGFLLDQGVYTTLDAPGGRSTIATDIDDHGRIVGISTTVITTSRIIRGFARDAQGAFAPIDVPNAAATLPYAINSRAQIVGFYRDSAGTDHGFLRDDQGFTTIDAPDATHNSTLVFDVNDGGQLVGGYDLVQHGYLRERRGDFRTIDHPDAGRVTEISGINNRGQIVGIYFDHLRRHGFLLSNGVITTLTVPGSFLDAGGLDIDDHGRIVGPSS
jgi:probable HAF family extracellular repeat protein